MPTELTSRVLVVGYGPVGQLLSVLLARKGWDVTVLERWPEPYTMPRAVAFDGECARILSDAGVGDHIAEFGEPSGDYIWRNADGDDLLHYVSPATAGLSGWPDSTSMYQPGLESALIARGASLPGLRVLRGYRATGLTRGADGPVTVEAVDESGGSLRVTADWVVGCDGANSFVRGAMDADWTDLGFRYDWLICDVVLDEAREFWPNNLQICDPARPRTAVSAGPGHRRWEFMRVPGESREEFDSRETAWRLLEEFDVRPDNATMDRHAVYTFQAGWAGQWRDGRLLIAGDAAHLMPPFAAQGMSSGFRDAANLAWKLDLVLAGNADDALLDTYTEERREHVRHAVDMSVSLGKVICLTDAQAAAERDELMLAMRGRTVGATAQPSAVHPLAGGFLHQTGAGPAGELTPQGRVSGSAEARLLDAETGTGLRLLTTEPLEELLDAERRAFLHGLGVRVVRILPRGAASSGGASVRDDEDVLLPYLDKLGAVAALVRPDFYLYGTAGDGEELRALVDGFRARLGEHSVRA